jgi:hypothetical protein
VQHRLAPSRLGRAVLSSLFLTDETVGLALTEQAPAARTMAITGGLAYIAWVAGTAAGVAGASIGGAEDAAAALFPVLFIGPAAVTASTRRDAVLAAGAGMATTAVLLIVAPAAGALGAIAAVSGSRVSRRVQATCRRNGGGEPQRSRVRLVSVDDEYTTTSNDHRPATATAAAAATSTGAPRWLLPTRLRAAIAAKSGAGSRRTISAVAPSGGGNTAVAMMRLPTMMTATAATRTVVLIGELRGRMTARRGTSWRPLMDHMARQ